MFKFFWRTGLLLAVLSTGIASAQYTVKRVVFSDPGTYSQSDLEAAAGIHPGQSLTTDELSTAAQKLSDSGYFEEIGGTLDGPFKAVSVLFTVKPLKPAQLMPAAFENFVWLTPEEIKTAIHAQIPLYDGYLPAAGTSIDAVDAALHQALAAKGIDAKVRHETVEPSFGHPVRVVEYVAARSVVLASATLTGMSPAMQPAVQKQIAQLIGKSYSEGLAGDPTTGLLLVPYQETGYLDAALSDVKRDVSQTPQQTQVALAAKVDEGAPYRVATLTYAGGPLMSAADFDKGAKLHAGDLAAHKALAETLAPLDAVYRAQGYMDVVVDVVPKRDAAAHQVAYAVTVVPGEQYRVHTVTPLGLSAAAQQDFDRGWLMKPGELYNPAYVANFLKQNTALRALAGYSAGFKASADPQTHLVDLTIQFVRAHN